MKVIKKLGDWQARQVSCSPGCGAVLEVEASDLHVKEHSEEGRSWTDVIVTCPECQRKIQIKDVPPWQVERTRRMQKVGGFP